jgi:hypothetical protein
MERKDSGELEKEKEDDNHVLLSNEEKLVSCCGMPQFVLVSGRDTQAAPKSLDI